MAQEALTIIVHERFVPESQSLCTYMLELSFSLLGLVSRKGSMVLQALSSHRS